MSLDFSTLTVTASQAASKGALDRAIGEYLGWVGDPIATLSDAAEKDEDFALAHVFTGVLRLLSGEVESASPGLAESRRRSKAAKSQLTAWERAHVAAFEAWGADAALRRAQAAA